MKPRYREPGVLGFVRTLARGFSNLVGAYRFMPNMVELPDGSVWLKIQDEFGSPTARVSLPQQSFLSAHEERRELRTEAAFEMNDDNVHAFVLFILREGEVGPELVLRMDTEDQWIGAFTASFARLIEGTRDLRLHRLDR